MITVRLQVVASATRPLKNRSRVRIHLGATEAIADFPSVKLGLDRSLVMPWNEGIGMELARKMGQAVHRAVEGLIR